MTKVIKGGTVVTADVLLQAAMEMAEFIGTPLTRALPVRRKNTQ